MNTTNKKILYIASTEIHLCSFHLPYLKWFKKQGYEIHVAYNGQNAIPDADILWSIPFGRSPIDKQNYSAYNSLKKVVTTNHFELIHCHTPMASFITRLASRFTRRKGTKVLYTAHGFHFFQNGPIKNWLLYFPAEWLLSYFTDAIITINKEDFNILHSKRFLSRNKYLINGIGINPDRLKSSTNGNKNELRTKLGYSKQHILVLYIAEFIDRKNHQFIIENIPKVIILCPNIKFLFAGGGILRDKMEVLASKKGIEKYVDFLGFRKDIGSFISICDIGISASKQEGLGLGIAEMMFNALPVIVTKDRGHNEMVTNHENGLMFNQNDENQFVTHLISLYKNSDLRVSLGKKGKETIAKFMIDESLDQMAKIYKNELTL